MAIRIFKSFRSTVTPFLSRDWFSPIKMLVDPTTGAPVGIQSPNANGADGIWTPIDVTAAQIASPSPGMVADLNATYRLNVAPYARYQSDGSQLVPVGAAEDEVVIPPGFNTIYYAPLTVAAPQALIVEGQVRVIAYAA